MLMRDSGFRIFKALLATTDAEVSFKSCFFLVYLDDRLQEKEKESKEKALEKKDEAAGTVQEGVSKGIPGDVLGAVS